jgi:carboxypeptidase C (cathepsin A)
MDGRITSLGRAEGFLGYPTIIMTAAPYTSALNNYVRRDLGYSTDVPYVFLSDEANRNWNWGSAMGGYVSALDSLRRSMTRNETLKVMAANGYSDLNTPYFAAKYSLDHLSLPSALRKNLTLKLYNGGHMFYTHEPSLAAFSSDVADFFRSALRQP